MVEFMVDGGPQVVVCVGLLGGLVRVAGGDPAGRDEDAPSDAQPRQRRPAVHFHRGLFHVSKILLYNCECLDLS